MELSSGTRVANVKALECALRKAGRYEGAADGELDAATEAAYQEWQEAKGMTVTGTLDIARFVLRPLHVGHHRDHQRSRGR